MTIHKKAFRDNYLAAIISAVAMLLSICIQAQKKYQPYPTPGQAKWWMMDSTGHIPYGSTPSLRGGDPRPGALFYVTSPSGDTSVYSWTGARWKKEGGGAGNNFDTTYQLIFSSIAFDHYLVYAYTDSSTDYHYYNDSIAIKGQSDLADNKFLGQKNGIVGFHPMYLQTVLDAGGGINKRNWLNFNGYKFNWDSIGGFHLAVKAFTDTAFSIRRGVGINLLNVDNSTGYTSVLNMRTNSGNVLINDASGMTVNNSIFKMANGSKIISENYPIRIERSRVPGTGGGLFGVVFGNDTLNLPFGLDSSIYAAFDIRFRNFNNNNEDSKFKVYGDGSVWVKQMRHASGQDSFLVKEGGYIKYRSLAEIIAAVGGGGGAVSSVFGRTGVVVAANGDYTWAQINKTTSSLADITTRNYSDLQNIPAVLTSLAGVSATSGLLKKTGATTVGTATAGTDYSPAISTTDHLLNLTPSTGAINMRKSITALTSGTSISVDMDNGTNYSLSLAHNAAITISDEQAGDWFQIWVTQTSGGNTLSIDGQSIDIDPAAAATTWIGGTWNGSGWIFSTNLSPIIDLTTDVTGRLPYSNIAQGSALSVLGVSGNASANISSIAAASDNQVMRRSGTSIGFGAINLASSNAVTGTLPITNGGTGLSSLGTANQLQRVNSGATALEYFTPSWITANQVHSEPTSRILLSNGSGGVASDPGATIVSGLLSLGQSSYAGGALKLVGDQAGSVSIKVRSSSSQDVYDLNLPLAAGAVGETMVMNGSGNLEWKNLTSGDYTPTVTNVANMISSTDEWLIYTRIDNKVRMDGSFSVSLTSGSASTTMRISLPISSDLQSNNDVRGMSGFVATASSVGTVTADTSNDEIIINFTPTATTGVVSFSLTYTVR